MTDVPVAELTAWLDAECTRRQCSLGALLEEAAPSVGMSADGLRAWIRRSCASGTADLGRTDALITALDGLLTDLPSQAAEQEQVTEAWCPGCRRLSTAGRDGACAWCGAATGAGAVTPTPARNRNAGTPILMGEEVLQEARRRYLAGTSMRQVAAQLLPQTAYRSVASFTSALYDQFARRGWPRRSQSAVTAARNYRHGRGARDRDESTYRKALRASRSHRCEGVTSAGRQCSRPAITGERWCPSHHPANAARRAAQLAAVREQWAEAWSPCSGVVENGPRTGQPCRRRAIPGTSLCHGHTPSPKPQEAI